MGLIRVAEVSDAGAIAQVHVQSWRETYAEIVPREYLASLNVADRVIQWQDWLGRGIRVFVAEKDGVVVGFAGGGGLREPIQAPEPNAIDDAELYMLYLLRVGQGLGLGRALLGAVTQSMLEQGYKSMVVWVLAENPAFQFYEHAGARYLQSKQIEIGGVSLTESALAWTDLTSMRKA